MLTNLITLIRTRFSPLIRWAVVGGIVVITIGAVGYHHLWPQPKVISPAGPALGIAQVSNVKPVKIVFNRLVKQSTLKHAIHPDLKGAWKVSNNILTGRSTLTFRPTESPDLDTRYTIELSGIKSIFGRRTEKYLLSFQTDATPAIKLTSPAEAAVDVLPDASILVTFDKPVSDGVAITAILTPALELDKPKVSGPTVTFSHAVGFQKSTTYVLQVFRGLVKVDYATKIKTVSAEPTELLSGSFTTIAAPGIQASAPTGLDVDPASAIRLEFKVAMERESTQAAWSITPTVAGAFSWENDQIMIFTPGQGLAKNQLYTVTLANTAKAANGITLADNFSWPFTTLGATAVSSASPAGGATGVDPATSISVGFNQVVVTASAESKFSITPAIPGSFSWIGTTMVFHPQATLAYSQVYTIAVAQGVQSMKGSDSVINWSSMFTTRSQSVMLSVPAYAQAHMYSCMIAAARSAMAFRGVTVSEAAIIGRVGRDTTAWSGTWGGANGVWGDPDVAMVGGLDNGAATGKSGSTKVTWGYGSHWGPIAKMLTSYGISNDVRTGLTVQQLAQSISDNNPVIIWWVNGIWPSYEVRWKTPSGKQVRGVNGLHVQVVRGFAGTVDIPTSFTVTDSGYGYPGRTIDIGTFKAKWAWFSNTGIIVK